MIKLEGYQTYDLACYRQAIHLSWISSLPQERAKALLATVKPNFYKSEASRVLLKLFCQTQKIVQLRGPAADLGQQAAIALHIIWPQVDDGLNGLHSLAA